MEFVKSFKDLSKKDVSLAGGKGASLGEMTQTKIPVPAGFVILSNAFENFIAETDIGIEIDSQLDKVNHQEIHTIERASETIKALILNSKMPEKTKEEIKNSFEKLGSKYVAVRSSATAEDSASDAWAGQLESYLNATEETLLDNVQKCWASLFTPRAIFYRFEKNLHKEKVSVAVVVQKMIDSEESGIAFSVHPVTQDRNQLIIEAGFGLGEAIVSGQVTPDSYVVNKREMAILDKNINEQKKALFKRESGGNEWKVLSKEVGSKQVLSDKEVLELSKLIIRIESHYGFPVDVEFAKEKGKFYIVQSRPITTLMKEPALVGPTFLSELSSHSFQLYEVSPVIPVVSWEYSFRAHINNPYYKMVNAKTPNSIIFQDKNFQVWEELSTKIKLSNKKLINKIISDGLKVVKANESKVNNFLKSELKINDCARWIKELNNIFLDLYSTYLFFTEEYFDTKDQDLLKRLPEVRMELSIFAGKVWEAYDKILFLMEKNYPFSKEELDRCVTSEILTILSGKKIERKNLKESQLAFTVIDNKFREFFNEEAVAIEEHLHEHDPRNQQIQRSKETSLFMGKSAYPGRVVGKVIKISENQYGKYKEIFNNKKNYILVTPMTRPEIVPFIKGAKAIITDEGGITCHAAIVARELKKPCIIGAKIATQVLQDGDDVEVDANRGVVKILKRKDELLNHLEEFDLYFESVGGFNFLLVDIMRRITKNLDLMTFVIGEKVIHFNGKNLRAATSKQAIKLCSDKKKFQKSINNFAKIKIEVEKAFRELNGKEDKPQLVKKFFEVTRKADEYYGTFDFDMSVEMENSLKNQDVLKNLHTLLNLKNEVKEFVNPYFLVGDNLFRKEIKKIGKIFGVDDTEIFLYTEKEILALYNGHKVSKEELTKRKKATVVASYKGKLYSYFGDEALDILEKLRNITNSNKDSIKGEVAFRTKEKIVGRVRIFDLNFDRVMEDVKNLARELEGKNEKVILVTKATTPEMGPIFKKFSAIISEYGGISTHAAIISRELKIPCIIGAKYATTILKENDLVEVDTSNGVVKVLKT